MLCIDQERRGGLCGAVFLPAFAVAPTLALTFALTLTVSLTLAGCSSAPSKPIASAQPADPVAVIPSPVAPAPSVKTPTPAPTPTASAKSPLAAKAVPRFVQLPAPAAVSTEAELKRQFAQRLMQAHPDSTYQTVAPNRLLAIPVLEVELNVDGSVRRIVVLRRPSTGDEATKLAIAAVHRAAPYGNVSRLKPPFKVVEAFLFDDAMRFKPRTLDIP